MKIILLTLIFIPQMLMAKTIFEPNLSLGSGVFKGDIDDVGLSGVEANYTTLTAGLRYGITREYIHVTAVADAYYVKLDSESVQNDGESLQGNIGLGFGYEWNIPLRTYVIIGLPTSSVEVAYYFDDSITVGLRYNRMAVSVANSDPLSTAPGGKINVNTFSLAVSFPFEFDYPGHWWRKKSWE